MNKLILRLDDLDVDSFDTSRIPEGEGTVAAHEYTDDRCCMMSCDGAHTCLC